MDCVAEERFAAACPSHRNVRLAGHIVCTKKTRNSYRVLILKPGNDMGGRIILKRNWTCRIWKYGVDSTESQKWPVSYFCGTANSVNAWDFLMLSAAGSHLLTSASNFQCAADVVTSIQSLVWERGPISAEEFWRPWEEFGLPLASDSVRPGFTWWPIHLVTCYFEWR